MKPFTSYSLLAAFAACGLAFGQQASTTPVGYVTESISGKSGPTAPDSFNLISVTLHASSIWNGQATGVSSTLLTAAADFDALLESGNKYIVRITSGDQSGAIVVVDQWGTGSGNSQGDLVVSQDLSQLGVAVGDSFEIRPAMTLSDVFGSDNSAGLKEGTLATADVVWVPTGGGSFEKYYYSPGATFPVPVAEGWKNSAGQNAANAAIVYTDAIFIQRRAEGDLNLVVSGEVIVSATQLFVEGGVSGNVFNYVGSVYPVGTKLGDSGLEASLKSGNLSTADIVWMPNGAGGYDKFYYSPGASFPVPIAAGWKDAAGLDASQKELTSGIIVQRRDAANVAPLLNPPADWDL